MWEIANILKISKSIKLLMKIKNMSFTSWEKTKQTFWPTQYIMLPNPQKYLHWIDGLGKKKPKIIV